MKKIYLLLAATTIVFSCGSDQQQSVDSLIAAGDLEAIKSRKMEIAAQQKELNTQIKRLDSVIRSMDKGKKLPLVSAFTVTRKHFEHFLELQGDVKTKQNVLIYPEMTGTLVRVYVTEGQRVRKGQILGSIDDGGMSSELEKLKTQATLAKTTFERQKRLWEQKIGSELQYLQSKANYEAAENAVSTAQSQLGKSVMRAPFSGIVDEILQDQGTTVSPNNGMPVFRVVNLSDMFIEVDVPENYLGAVTKGRTVKVFFPVLNDSVTTQIRQTGNFIDPANRTFDVEIPVPNTKGEIKPNLMARVSINDYTNPEALLIPQSVISENAEGQQYVYSIISSDRDGTKQATRQIITTGLAQNNYVEVLSGISEGDQVIMEGARSVRDGQEVRIN